jgi:hypothetical protein
VIVDALENIGANKITAIFGRTDAKDFVDLYFILSRLGFWDSFANGKAKGHRLDRVLSSGNDAPSDSTHSVTQDAPTT